MNRTSASTLALLLASAGLSANAESYLNFLRQTHYDSGVVWDFPIGSSGTMPSPLGVGELGSLYELWALDTESASQIELRREMVSTYSPQISVTFETADPYQLAPRTRVDQPFTARVSIAGSDPDWKNSLAETIGTFDIVHLGFLFPGNDYTLDDAGGANEPQVIRQFRITENGEYVFQFPMTNLTGADMTKLVGAEFFAITSPDRYNSGHGNNADGVDGDNPGLAKKLDIILSDEVLENSYVVGNIFEWSMVQIWPIAEGSIEGIDGNMIYGKVPPVSLRLVDLYPDSTTYLRVYKGSPNPAPANLIKIGPAAVVIHDSTPQDRTIVVSDLDKYLPEEGSYTLEVIHTTPFGTEILSQFYPLQVDWDIDFHGNIISIE